MSPEIEPFSATSGGRARRARRALVRATARAAAKHLWWPRAARAKGSGQSKPCAQGPGLLSRACMACQASKPVFRSHCACPTGRYCVSEASCPNFEPRAHARLTGLTTAWHDPAGPRGSRCARPGGTLPELELCEQAIRAAREGLSWLSKASIFSSEKKSKRVEKLN